MLGADRARLETFLDDLPAETAKSLFAIPVVPGSPALEPRTYELLTDRCRLLLVANGLDRSASRELARRYDRARVFRTGALPGFPAKHGTLLTLLLSAIPEDFGVLDDDCYVRDGALLEVPQFGEREFLAVPDHVHFFTVHEPTGRRYPRTHFLIFQRARILELMNRYAIDAQKVVHPPRALAPLLAKLELGPSRYPRTYLRYFDTMLLLISVALASGLEVRWLRAAPDAVLHRRHLEAEMARAGTATGSG